MKFLEKDLQDIIYENIVSKRATGLSDRGLYLGCPTEGNLFIEKEFRIGNYGVADIIFAYRDIDSKELVVTIIELKLKTINTDALLQISRYKAGVEDYLSKRGVERYTVNVVLIGNKIDLNSDFVYLCNIAENVILEIYTFSYGLNGIIFNEVMISNYALIDNGFNLNNKS